MAYGVAIRINPKYLAKILPKILKTQVNKGKNSEISGKG